MDWEIEFYGKVEEELAKLPPKIQARMIRLMELMEKHGANLGEPHTKPLGDELFEIRAKAKEGIGRGIFCYMQGKRIIVLHVFVKKDQKIPKKDLELANERLKEVKKS
ncbi:MAG: type II toxin-antitoxin system RelE/ParE family toxin [Marinobacter sp.]|uniref:type II toxin-antitoxin system RelE/ParE family toxin n=1 Tax=Marinobacter TaxID=2742 RepID=UPI000D0FB394|nr:MULTISPECIES: type II toxin-antitoxin system RelE/ParE family toxin [Marinobacter]MDX5441956.1 type II toxin-antitoxin system RelE/ParE family toxin [Alteromonadaceae bacterium]MDX5329020.1 type II toxin-antitoxin system RelE/ParE family toxin [Marinobacter sp.]MDX5385210.1 type II toxin-antitoxin system RelE/ParE family toxin [Marinobacter sp.]MDX5470913.1 type II toxin-antitoxin system RelE/ParE family toxin [Marinobacter sp.]PSF12637.1 type II toxin-antitoxin system RelE/ParE family toxi